MVDIAKTSLPEDSSTQHDADRQSREAELRAKALKRLKKRRDLAAHALVYVMFNAFFIAIWAVTSHGFFWPM
ncbi:MAG TPA: 2TM domain-containing protein, partial [Mycobacteriales bacterium]|nr:2TM domain-containing protein [Mycobacteriales bacterium]